MVALALRAEGNPTASSDDGSSFAVLMAKQATAPPVSEKGAIYRADRNQSGGFGVEAQEISGAAGCWRRPSLGDAPSGWQSRPKAARDSQIAPLPGGLPYVRQEPLSDVAKSGKGRFR